MSSSRPARAISAASRNAFLRRRISTANIGASRAFPLFVSKTYKTVVKLPFNKRLTTLAVAYAKLSPADLASLKAAAQKNAVLRQACRDEIKRAATQATPFGLFVTKNKALYGELGFTGATKAIANKYKALSAAEKAELAKKAAANNAAVKKAADRLEKA